MLEALGIAPDEAAAYEALLESALEPSSPASHDVMERLVDRGLARHVNGSGYVAVSPALALPGLVEARERELAGARRRAAELAALAQDAVRRPGNGIALVSDPVAVREEVQAIFVDPVRGARAEVVGFDHGPYVDKPRIEPAEATALERGVSVRALYDQQMVASTPHILDGILESIAHGEKARVAHVPFMMLVNDRRRAVVSARPHAPGAAHVISDPTLCQALWSLFELCWVGAIPLAPLDGAIADEFVTDNRDLLLLLASGCTDSQIARELGCAERTVRRRLEAVRRRLGATSRFQIGYHAVMQGWLSDDVDAVGA